MTGPEILYEDKDVVVVCKPAGMASQPDRTLSMDMLSWLRNRGRDPGERRAADFYVVHRLDRPVGGVMVYARNRKAAGILSESVKNGGMYKEYAAVLTGMPGGCGDGMTLMEDYILPGKGPEISRVVESCISGAKRAALEYRVLAVRPSDNGQQLSLVRIHLLTGRRHQIRAQMAHAGAGIWGDTKYNPVFAGRHGRFSLALFARKLGFEHPLTGRHIEFAAALPGAITNHFPDAQELF